MYGVSTVREKFMELLQMFWKEILLLSAVGLPLGGVLVFILAKVVDSGLVDSKETRLFIKEEEFKK